MRIVCMSDLHTKRPRQVPDGDVLIVSGDWCIRGDLSELAKNSWVAEQPHKHKVAIAGNHDFCLQNEDRELAKSLVRGWGVTYLEDQPLMIDGLKFYGSPWQPNFHNWAFQKERGPELAAVWSKIPDDTNVLITHGPPEGILDVVPRYSSGYGGYGHVDVHLGDCDLYARSIALDSLKLHVFGHIHYSHGQTKFLDTLYVNAAVCDERYQPSNEPIVVDL